mmetsp:Transcript_20297/g.28332  ORF Transcript_20297/g.28332 Transcript_20297/m.28332 type:complete len:225 (-) Transcript_20297:15-689(-)
MSISLTIIPLLSLLSSLFPLFSPATLQIQQFVSASATVIFNGHLRSWHKDTVAGLTVEVPSSFNRPVVFPKLLFKLDANPNPSPEVNGAYKLRCSLLSIILYGTSWLDSTEIVWFFPQQTIRLLLGRFTSPHRRFGVCVAPSSVYSRSYFVKTAHTAFIYRLFCIPIRQNSMDASCCMRTFLDAFTVAPARRNTFLRYPCRCRCPGVSWSSLARDIRLCFQRIL